MAIIWIVRLANHYVLMPVSARIIIVTVIIIIIIFIIIIVIISNNDFLKITLLCHILWCVDCYVLVWYHENSVYDLHICMVRTTLYAIHVSIKCYTNSC